MMKMKKLFILLISLLSITGCSIFKRDSMENISIITTNYALEYVVDYLYGDNSLGFDFIISIIFYLFCGICCILFSKKTRRCEKRYVTND